MASALRCDICGFEVEADPDVERDGGYVICGECARARNFDELLWELEAEDDAIDGHTS